MRKWFKYSLDLQTSGTHHLSLRQAYEEHAEAQRHYQPNGVYQSKRNFFHHYLDKNRGRHYCYDLFLKKRLTKGMNILSVASGTCVNEMALLEKGYQVCCSDLVELQIHGDTRKLFPAMSFFKLDIVRNPAPDTYDAVLCLGMLFLCDREQIRSFFRNVYSSLKLDGRLIIDLTGPSDHLLTWCMDVLLFLETLLLRWRHFFCTGKMPALVIRHHGYYWNDRDVINIAREMGFEVLLSENSLPLFRFQQSGFINKLIKANSTIAALFSRIGKMIPYVRIFDLKKVS